MLTGTHVEFFHQSVGAGGDNLNPAFIGGDAAESAQLWLQLAQLCSFGANAQVLLLPGADGHAPFRLSLIGIARHQLHIHKGRFTRLVKTLPRHHRIVPIKHLPPTLDGRRRRFPRCAKPVSRQPSANQRR
ncbi:hypothetical protein D3C72_1946210 [compost metagenome]